MVETKYGFNINKKTVESDVNRLTNQIWKLLPMRENNEENWESQLASVILEISGLHDVLILDDGDVRYLSLLSKLEGLQKEQVPFEIFRKTIFECISLFRGVYNVK